MPIAYAPQLRTQGKGWARCRAPGACVEQQVMPAGCPKVRSSQHCPTHKSTVWMAPKSALSSRGRRDGEARRGAPAGPAQPQHGMHASPNASARAWLHALLTVANLWRGERVADGVKGGRGVSGSRLAQLKAGAAPRHCSRKHLHSQSPSPTMHEVEDVPHHSHGVAALCGRSMQSLLSCLMPEKATGAPQPRAPAPAKLVLSAPRPTCTPFQRKSPSRPLVKPAACGGETARVRGLAQRTGWGCCHARHDTLCTAVH